MCYYLNAHFQGQRVKCTINESYYINRDDMSLYRLVPSESVLCIYECTRVVYDRCGVG